MRRQIILTVFVLIGVVSVSVPAWSQTETGGSWIPADHLVAYPQYMSVTSYLGYTAEAESPWNAGSARTLQLFGEIEVIDPNGLLGLCNETFDVRVLDEAADEVDTPSSWPNDLLYEPVTYYSTQWFPSGEITWDISRFDFSVTMSVNLADRVPTLLSRVEFSLLAMLSETITVVDLPFAPREDWVEVAPGLEVLLEQTLVEDNRYKHVSTVVRDPNAVAYPYIASRSSTTRGGLVGYAWPAHGLPEAIVMEIDVIDSEGNSLQNHGNDVRLSGVSTSGDYDEQGRMILTQTITGSGSGVDDIAFVRYVVAHQPYATEIRLTMSNIPLPDLQWGPAPQSAGEFPWQICNGTACVTPIIGGGALWRMTRTPGGSPMDRQDRRSQSGTIVSCGGEIL